MSNSDALTPTAWRSAPSPRSTRLPAASTAAMARIRLPRSGEGLVVGGGP